MSEQYEFTVTVGTSDVIDDRADAAEVLQWLVTDANQRHEDVNYVTVQHSEMGDYEVDRLLEMLRRFDGEDIDAAIDAIDSLEEE